MPTLSLHPSNHQYERNGAQILAAVVHSTVGTNSLGWLTQNPEGVSAHALIPKSGHIYRMVPDGKSAGHVGNSQIRLQQRTFGSTTKPTNNQVTLGVELENLNNGEDPYPDDQVASVGWLLSNWAHTTPLLALLRHADIDTTGKSDPRGLSWLRIYAAMAPWLIAPVAGSYRLNCDTPVWEAPDVYAPVALGGSALLRAGAIEVCGPLTNGPTTWLHVSSGVGFIPRIAAELATSTPPSPNPPYYTEDAPIIAPNGLSRDALARAMIARCKASPYADSEIEALAFAFFDLGMAGWVDAAVAAAQCCHETGNLTDPNSLPPEHNTAGIGNTAGSGGVIFPSLGASAVAQVGRLIAYAVAPDYRTPQQQEIVNEAMRARDLPAKCHGSAPHLYLLGSDPNRVDGCGWASPGTSYGASIANVANALVELAK